MNVTGLDHKGEYNEVSSKTTPDTRRMPGQVQAGQRSIAEGFEQFLKMAIINRLDMLLCSKGHASFKIMNQDFGICSEHLNHGILPLTRQLSLVTTYLSFMRKKDPKCKSNCNRTAVLTVLTLIPSG